MLHLLVCSLALLAPLAQGELLDKRNTLESRDCPAGSTTCSDFGTFSYCAPSGYKCCSQRQYAPNDATCCGTGLTYAPSGNYCCTNGRYCPNGRTCTGCTPERGGNGFVPSSVPAVTRSTTRAPTVTTTRVVGQNIYYTYTITYYYFAYYYIYVPSITRSTPTSSTVTTTTVVSVFASNSADARSSLNDLTATVSLFTPASATFLPPLPSQTGDSNLFPSSTSSRSALSTSSPTQIGGGSSGAGRTIGDLGVYKSVTGWMLGLVAGGAAFGILFL